MDEVSDAAVHVADPCRIVVAGSPSLGAVASASDARDWDDDRRDRNERPTTPTSTSLVGVLFGALVLGALGVRTITVRVRNRNDPHDRRGDARVGRTSSPSKTGARRRGDLFVALLRQRTSPASSPVKRILSSEQIERLHHVTRQHQRHRRRRNRGQRLRRDRRRPRRRSSGERPVANILMALVVIGGHCSARRCRCRPEVSALQRPPSERLRRTHGRFAEPLACAGLSRRLRRHRRGRCHVRCPAEGYEPGDHAPVDASRQSAHAECAGAPAGDRRRIERFPVLMTDPWPLTP